MKRIFPLLILSALFIATGCVSSRNAKKGAKLMESGQYEAAAQAYLVSLAADRTNTDAIVGVKQAGQRAIDQKAIDVIKAQDANDVKTAVTKFIEIRDFVNQASALGVNNLLISEMAKSSFEEAKPIYLEQIYGEGQVKLESEQFQQAEALFTEVSHIEPGYMEVDELLVIAKCEPIYRRAQQSFNAGKYRTAYTTYSLLVKEGSGYKDAADLMNEAFSKAQLTIKVENFSAKPGVTTYAATLKTSLISAINAKKNLFIAVVDAKNIDKLIEEQQRSVSKGLDIEIGKILAPKAILSGNISEYEKSTGKLNKTEKRGYLKRIVKEKQADGTIKDVTLYDKVTYTVCEQKNIATICFNYQVTSIETGAVMIADKVREEEVSTMMYVEFNGDSKNLVPGYWEYPNKDSAKDVVTTDLNEINKLRSACKNKREIKSADTLLDEATTSVIARVAQQIDKYNPEK